MTATIRSITRREAFETRWPDIQVCPDADHCVKRVNPPNKGAHDRGVTDNWGVIHLSNLDSRVRAQGMYELCVLVALRQRDIKRLPEYHRIWKSHTWATEEMKRKFHRLARIRWSVDERALAWRLAERAGIFMSDNLSFYWWCYLGRRIAIHHGDKHARSQRRNYISDGLIAAWVADREAGMGFGEMGRKYNRDYRTIFKALVRRGLHEANMV